MVDIDQFRTLDELRARQAEVKNEITKLHEEHGGQSFPEEVRSTWNEFNDEMDALTARIDELEKREARIKEIVEQRGPSVSVPPSSPPQIKREARVENPFDLNEYRRAAATPEEHVRMLRDGAMKIVEGAVYPGTDDADEARGHIEKLMEKVRGKDGEDGSGKAHLAQLIIATGSQSYKRAFGKAISGRPLTNEESFTLDRALSLTGASGGFAVPFDLDPTILGTSNGAVNPFRQIARVEQITTDEWRGVSSAGITASYAAEATETTDNAPTLVQPTVSTEKAQAFVPFSIEVGQDWGGLQAEMGRLLQDAKDELEAAKFATGSGTNEPFGVVTGTTNTVNAASGQTFTLANLYALMAALPPRYQPRASFVGDLQILNRIRQFETTGGSTSAVWVDGLQADTPARLLGRPVYQASEMADSPATGAKFLIYGDFSRYLIVDRVGLTVETIQHLVGTNHRPTGQRGLYAYWRNGAKVLDANAFRALLGVA